MTMRAFLERNSAADTTGDDNLPVPPAYQEHAEIPCWLYTKSETETINGRSSVVKESLRLMVPRNADVKETDRINGVQDRRGNWIREGALQIQAVIHRHTHLELDVTGVE